MQMVGQQDHGVDFKGPFDLAFTERLSQQRAISLEMKQSPTSMRDDSKKESSTWNMRAAIVRHARNLSGWTEEGRQAGACPT